MGLAKQQQIEEQRRGFSCDETLTVCTGCFEEQGVTHFIEEHQSSTVCSFCKDYDEDVIACKLELVIDHILNSIHYEWGDPNNEGLSYITREGGWQGKVYETWSLMEIIGLDTINHDVFTYIVDSIHNQQWCKKEPYSLKVDQTFMYGWSYFCSFVKTKSRYLFLNARNPNFDTKQHDEMDPVKILDVLGSIVNRVSLTNVISKDTDILRVRITELDQHLTDANELGSPPIEYAIMPNRMSPAGIPMFYGAFDMKTAISETYQQCDTDKKAICGVFRPIRDLVLIDLPEKSSVPSIFDEHKRKFRSDIKFLQNFVHDFIKPIARDDRAHIDYVPTQIVTEYFRHVFQSKDGVQVDGIIYPSSKNEGHRAVVIFATSEQCIDADESFQNDSLLRLVGIESQVLVGAGQIS